MATQTGFLRKTGLSDALKGKKMLRDEASESSQQAVLGQLARPQPDRQDFWYAPCTFANPVRARDGWQAGEWCKAALAKPQP